MNNAETLNRGLDLLDLTLDNRADVLDRLLVYFQKLKKWMPKVNLVARDSSDLDILEKHFLDSLTLLPLMPQEPEDAGLLDVGSGAGFPGLILKIACPSLRVTLVEPREKRVFFLRQVIRTLGLKEVEVLQVRLGERDTDPALAKRTFSVVTCRAFSDLKTFLDLAWPYCAPGGRIICMKGPKGKDEVEELRSGDSDPLHLAEVREFELPFSKGRRQLLVFCRDG